MNKLNNQLALSASGCAISIGDYNSKLREENTALRQELLEAKLEHGYKMEPLVKLADAVGEGITEECDECGADLIKHLEVRIIGEPPLK